MAAKNKTTGRQCQLTHADVAKILTERGYPVSAKIVWHLEHQALKKLASHPALRRLAAELGLVPAPEMSVAAGT